MCGASIGVSANRGDARSIERDSDVATPLLAAIGKSPCVACGAKDATGSVAGPISAIVGIEIVGGATARTDRLDSSLTFGCVLNELRAVGFRSIAFIGASTTTNAGGAFAAFGAAAS